jgi:uroporphyrin-III C-methyltransferase/precorrin-2 dehydrogenase/sirohydrochlorin ferrochelatase
VIYYDRTVSTGILDLARRDAERVPVAPVTNCASLPSGKFSGTVIAGSRQGQRAVLIGSNEPLGLMSAILDDVCSADIDCEIVPGIPATPSRKDPVPSPAPAKLSTVQSMR